MTGAMGIMVDNVPYHVLIEYDSLERTFNLVEGKNTGTALTGRAIRDILGTGYDYQMTFYQDPDFPEDYYYFYEKISEPVDYHKIQFPYGDKMVIFDMYVESGTDKFKGNYNSEKQWGELSITFKAYVPKRK